MQEKKSVMIYILNLLTFEWYVGFSIWNVAFIASGYMNALYKDCKGKQIL